MGRICAIVCNLSHQAYLQSLLSRKKIIFQLISIQRLLTPAMDFALWEVPPGIQKKFNTAHFQTTEPQLKRQSQQTWMKQSMCKLRSMGFKWNTDSQRGETHEVLREDFMEQSWWGGPHRPGQSRVKRMTWCVGSSETLRWRAWCSCWKGPFGDNWTWGSMERKAEFEQSWPKIYYLFNINQTFPKNLGTQLFLLITTQFTLLIQISFSGKLSPCPTHTRTWACAHTHTHQTYIQPHPSLTFYPSALSSEKLSLPYVVLHTFLFLCLWSVSFPPQDYKLSEGKDLIHFVKSGIIPSPLNTDGTQEALNKYLMNE